jgi:hypothetical protein
VKSFLQEFDKRDDGYVIIDFGAGTGQLATIVLEETKISPLCIEIDNLLVETLMNRNFQTFSSINDSKLPMANLVYTSNVLEHIEDDLLCLTNIREKLLPGGLLAIFVPALPFLYSNFDHQVGHFRRYRRSELAEKVTSAGFQIVSIKYFDSLGIFTWLVMKMIRVRPSTKNGISLLMRIYDNVIFPISRVFDACGMSSLAGKNLLVIARKVS